MRLTYRTENTKSYWEQRWANIPADAPAQNADVYPLKYAEMTVRSRDGRILEAGCGNGRVLRYYKDRGHDIVGMDYTRTSIEKLAAADPELVLDHGDVRDLPYADRSFRYVLAFGLYHSLPPQDLLPALRETLRVMEPGGRLCASFRADNLHNRWVDRRAGRLVADGARREFHKLNLTRGELLALFAEAGFETESVHPVENMPLLYRFRSFRARTHKRFDESRGRREGYLLSPTGAALQRVLMGMAPAQLCNVHVLIVRRPEA